MFNNVYLFTEAKAWVKRKNGPDEVVRIIPAIKNEGRVKSYELFVAYDYPEYLGRILFDENGFWIYEGTVFSVPEQEQLAVFIINYKEAV
ncbi:hypothetical protein ACPPVU_11655 [Mucilaginibacter sp. McL0603]|uniref:hypothetical protein n=1 Tax=Mucilaginibacter sp. McL0603 TaxID=3415670 RepID=UPI003CECDE75